MMYYSRKLRDPQYEETKKGIKTFQDKSHQDWFQQHESKTSRNRKLQYLFTFCPMVLRSLIQKESRPPSPQGYLRSLLTEKSEMLKTKTKTKVQIQRIYQDQFLACFYRKLPVSHKISNFRFHFYFLKYSWSNAFNKKWQSIFVLSQRFSLFFKTNIVVKENCCGLCARMEAN